MATPEQPDDDAAMRERLATLSRDLGTSGAAKGPASGSPMPKGVGQAMNLGFRVMSEFVAAVAVGAFIGWLLDRWLHTSPLGLIIFLGLGTAAGFWSVYRVAVGPGAK